MIILASPLLRKLSILAAFLALMALVLLNQNSAAALVFADHGSEESHDAALSEHYDTASHDEFLSDHEEADGHALCHGRQVALCDLDAHSPDPAYADTAHGDEIPHAQPHALHRQWFRFRRQFRTHSHAGRPVRRSKPGFQHSGLHPGEFHHILGHDCDLDQPGQIPSHRHIGDFSQL